MQIDYLAEHPDWIETLARWHHQQWSYLNPQRTLEQRIRRLHDHLTPGRIPTTVVAHDDGNLLGSASLVENDLEDQTDLTPWLASVFVAPEQRRRGVGTALVRRVMQEAERLRVPVFYLFTPDRESFYADLGWTKLEERLYNGESIVVMSCRLPPDTNGRLRFHAARLVALGTAVLRSGERPPLVHQVLQFFRHPEAESKERFHIDQNLPRLSVICQVQLQGIARSLGHAESAYARRRQQSLRLTPNRILRFASFCCQPRRFAAPNQPNTIKTHAECRWFIRARRIRDVDRSARSNKRWLP